MKRPLVVEAEPAFRTQHANPYNARLYTAVMEQGVLVRDLSYLRVLLDRVDIVHLHWPDLTFLSGTRQWRVAARLFFFFSFLRVARLRGTRVMWTVHNVAAHETRSTPWLRRWYRRSLLANVDGIISLSDSGVHAARGAYSELRRIPAFVAPHGHYRHDYDLTLDRARAREQLGLDRRGLIVLAIGQIRPYKNIPNLIRIFRSSTTDSTLVVAGQPLNTALATEIAEAAGSDHRVIVEPEFQSNERMALWLRASNLVVLPYAAIQNSGSAILAVSADRPVLVPAIGAMTELAEALGEQWVRAYSNDLSLAILEDAMSWSTEGSRPAVADLTEIEWDGIARKTIAAYEALLQCPRVSTRVRRASVTDAIASVDEPFTLTAAIPEKTEARP